ncbi:MAG: bifunctional isocitrate dehydrogenase kinase/phosphatase [Gammaproteobacteria bacterium]|nr:bifunctional isocitrate dehydrogenase kinase/phosphatase [Gammaproteobacteria bacterium]MBU1646253.1 bifunctional isocitrate dehydrogenase kinase/phosphatase [Gammaproteobacteria bacterium]MBU1970739.1 bifunctional isocitrate dehydrogenase kinase/phosphatase [Gammaproteobacteria bacterium]
MAPQQLIAQRIATMMIEGFNRHYRVFRDCSASAKARFDAADWMGVQQAVKERIAFYDDRVRETLAELREDFHAEVLDDLTWQQAKLHYIGELLEHEQPELAETFFNSVFCRIMHRTYFHNDFIFVRPAISTEFFESEPPTYRSYYPNAAGLGSSIRRVFLDFCWERSFEDIDRDIEYVMLTLERHLGEWPQAESNFQIQVLNSAFYRNKAAYVIGKAVNGANEYPFAVPVLHTAAGQLYLDTVILDGWRIGALFSLSRAYFMVDMPAPADYVHFLRTIMPNKPRSELYTMLGLGKQGKTMFFRDLMYHLHHSEDQFIVAPGIRGLVMLVFTLPSYPYVFKVIKDVFGATKEVDHETVMRKYQLVKQVDRVGRMADTLEFSYAAFPRTRLSPELIDELQRLVPSQLEADGDDLIIKHLYIERRMEPLNLHLDKAMQAGREDVIDEVVEEYGNAIRELAIANIFPGDMLWKNFGVTRYGRVVFYDYDEIEYMTDCNFRRIPIAPDLETEMSGEVWYSVGRNDIFPEEFATFLLTSPNIRQAFMRHHSDLLDAGFWQQAQEQIRRGVVLDFFPYPESLRFCNVFELGCSDR